MIVKLISYRLSILFEGALLLIDNNSQYFIDWIRGAERRVVEMCLRTISCLLDCREQVSSKVV